MKASKKNITKRIGLLLCLLLLNPIGGITNVQADQSVLFAPPAPSAPLSQDGRTQDPVTKKDSERRLAIIIDDLGNSMGGTEEILNLPVKVTVAVMPFMRTTEQDARRAHELGHDVLIHMPMEPKQGKPEWRGPGAILSGMTDEEVRKKVEEAIDNVPFAKGINNHMGSKITGDDRIMAVILQVCRERGLFFVDSKTNYWSVTSQISEKMGMPRLSNDIFLDDVHNTRHIAGQLNKIQELLDQKGKCVAIGHVGVKGAITAATLKQYVPEFQARGVRFIGISELAKEQKGPGTEPGRGVTSP